MSTTTKTQAQIDRLVEEGKATVVAIDTHSTPTAVMLETYDRQGRARRATIEIKEAKPLSRAAAHRQSAASPAELPAPDATTTPDALNDLSYAILMSHTPEKLMPDLTARDALLAIDTAEYTALGAVVLLEDATTPRPEADIEAEMDQIAQTHSGMRARITAINGRPMAEIIAQDKADEEADTARTNALLDRPIHSAEKKAANRLAHATTRLAEAQAYANSAQADLDDETSKAETAWIASKTAKRDQA